MPDLAQVTLGFLVFAMFAASVAMWAGVYSRWRRRDTIVPAEPGVAVPWKVLDLYIVFVLYVGAQFAAAKALLSIAGIAPGALRSGDLGPVLASNALANLLVVLASIIYLRLRHGAAVGDLGFLPWRPGYDLLLGLSTFVAALVPVFAIQFLLTRWFKSEHPVQVLLSENSTPQVLLLCFVSAVLVAPLAEEFLFRVLLQGWLEAIARRRRGEPLAVPVVDKTPTLAADTQPAVNQSSPTDEQNSYASPLQKSVLKAATVESPTERLMPWPIIFSSLAFALVHWGHGPDPIPLFVFALMLGYLYQKTHRIWPSLVVHASLNAWSLTMLWLNLKLGLGD